jgi:hypothetical protein
MVLEGGGNFSRWRRSDRRLFCGRLLEKGENVTFLVRERRKQ